LDLIENADTFVGVSRYFCVLLKGKMWMHEHHNLKDAPDLVTFSKKMLSGGIYHKVILKPMIFLSI
jgi:hypothetical protein